MISSLYLLKLLNIFAVSLIFKNQQEKQTYQNKSTILEINNKTRVKSTAEKKEIEQKKKCSGKKTCCCQQEIAGLLDKLSKRGCEIKVLLTTGTACCKLKGLIKDIRKKGSLLLLISPETNAQWYIPIDKIAAIYTTCPC